tara:strand:+ start:760 stop:1023 length:264 start_codon:yes stop_codon:yes gene_type:complete
LNENDYLAHPYWELIQKQDDLLWKNEESAQFDALSGLALGRDYRIFKACMCSITAMIRYTRVPVSEQKHFLGSHFRTVIPALRGIVS